jgi:hypothetical protein
VLVRHLAWLVAFVIGCDHRPPPPRPNVADVAPTVDAAPVPAGDDVCLQIGAKIAEIIISSTTDATQKAAYEQERTKLVKRFSENCANEQWPDAIRACFLAAKTSPEIEACSRDLAKLQPTPPPAASSTSRPPPSRPPATPPSGVN